MVYVWVICVGSLVSIDTKELINPPETKSADK